MATTTARIEINSADLLSDNMALSATMNLYKGGTTDTGLDQINYHRLVIPTGTNFDLIEESAALTEDANYVYIINKNTDVADYVTISINEEIIGSLYAGDWMFIPWSCDISAAANDSTIELQAFTAPNTIEYALFHVGETLVTATDA
jgi:hypothetical protein